MTDPTWYRHYYGPDYLHIYESYLTTERTTREVDQLLSLLAPPQGGMLLDVCCGHGRHTSALTARGYRAVGIDLSRLFLQRAQERATPRQLALACADMRQLPFSASFDAAFVLYNSFGALEDDQQHLAALRAIAATLRPGGWLLIDSHSRPALEQDDMIRQLLPPEETLLPDGTLVLEQQRFNATTGRSEGSETLVRPDGSTSVYRRSTRVYTLEEYGQLLPAAGLRLERWYGGLDGSNYAELSHRLVVIAAKLPD